MAPHNAWNAREYGRTASPPEATDRFTETDRAFKQSQATCCRHKGTFSPNAANLPAAEPAHRQRFGWSSVSCQIPRQGLFRTESSSPSGYVAALDTFLDAASNAHINRQVASTVSAIRSPAYAPQCRSASPLSAKRILCGQNHRFAMLHKTHRPYQIRCEALIEHRRVPLLCMEQLGLFGVQTR